MRRDAAENRRLLIEAAAAAFRAEGPTISLEGVAKVAGVGIGTLYRHFAHRGELMLAVLQARLNSYAECVTHHPGGPALITDFLQLISEGIAIYAVAAGFIHEQSGRSLDYAQVFDRFNAILAELVERGRRERALADWVTPELLVTTSKMLVGVYADARVSGTDPDIDGALRILLRGIGPPAGEAAKP